MTVIGEYKELLKAQETANRHLAGLMPEMERISNTLRVLHTSDFLQNYLKLTREIARPLENFSKITQGLLKSFDPFYTLTFEWSKIPGLFAETLDIQSEEEYTKFEYRFAGFLSSSDYISLYKLHKAGDSKGVREFFYNLFSDPAKIGAIKARFSKAQFFDKRSTVLTDALDAHLVGKYSLSVPVFLAQLDGIFIERHSDLKGKITSTCKQCGKKSDVPLTARGISEYLAGNNSEYFDVFLQHVAEVFEQFRNAILHGKDVSYGTKELSTKILVTLFQLYVEISADNTSLDVFDDEKDGS